MDTIQFNCICIALFSKDCPKDALQNNRSEETIPALSPQIAHELNNSLVGSKTLKSSGEIKLPDGKKYRQLPILHRPIDYNGNSYGNKIADKHHIVGCKVKSMGMNQGRSRAAVVHDLRGPIGFIHELGREGGKGQVPRKKKKALVKCMST